jgi:hypothetical protein
MPDSHWNCPQLDPGPSVFTGRFLHPSQIASAPQYEPCESSSDPLTLFLKDPF